MVVGKKGWATAEEINTAQGRTGVHGYISLFTGFTGFN
jgi:hypothetical protein